MDVPAQYDFTPFAVFSELRDNYTCFTIPYMFGEIHTKIGTYAEYSPLEIQRSRSRNPLLNGEGKPVQLSTFWKKKTLVLADEGRLCFL